MIFERTVELHDDSSSSSSGGGGGFPSDAQDQPHPHRTRCLIADPCHVFNSNQGVTLEDTAVIAHEAFKQCR
jgi:hypothetical protein